MDKLREALQAFVRSSIPVATQIDPRGRVWSDAYLDEALALARAALAEPACAADPGECKFNGACMYHCGRAEPPVADEPVARTWEQVVRSTITDPATADRILSVPKDATAGEAEKLLSPPAEREGYPPLPSDLDIAATATAYDMGYDQHGRAVFPNRERLVQFVRRTVAADRVRFVRRIVALYLQGAGKP